MFLWLRKIIIHFLINFAALYACAIFLNGISITAEGGSIWVALAVASLIFGIANVMLKPLLTFFSMPFLILSLGLFMFVINACMLELTAYLVQDFVINDFRAALEGALLITGVHIFATWLLGETLKK